jgi:signal transduction histidine kinase
MRAELESLAQDTQLRSETRESLGSVLEEVERLREIVEGLLALSRLDVGEPPSEWARFDLAELAASTAEQMSLLAEDKELTVVCELSGEVTVEADRARIKQVVLSVARDGDFALLEVTDNGIGIPAEAVARVFNRFYRVDESRSREQGGAGLGLAIVKSICAAHGAQVQVVSTPGKGSRFRIRQRLALNRAAHG